MITEELAGKPIKRPNGRRSQRGVTVKDLKALIGRIEKAGGKPGTFVKFARDSDGGIRLVAQIDK